MTFIIFMTFGGVIGWLLAQNNRGTAYGAVTDLAVGAVGGLIGGWAVAELGIAGPLGFLLALAVAIVAAGGLVKIVKTITAVEAAG